MDHQRVDRNSVGQGLRLVGQVALLAAIYFATGRLGLELAHYHDNVTLFWPPTGVSLAALILYGPRLWPGVFLGALALTASIGEAPIVTAGFAVGNTLEAVVGAQLLRAADFRPNLERVRDVVLFVLIGGFASSALSAIIGASTLAAVGQVDVAGVLGVGVIWWLGDLGGALIVAPLLLLARVGTPAWLALLGRRETWLVLASLAAIGWLAFGGFLAEPADLIAAFLLYPFLVWAGGRLGPRGAVTASALVTLIAVLGTARGHGPFVSEDVHSAMLLLWAYGMGIGTAALTLAAAISQHEAAESHRFLEVAGRHRAESMLNQAQRLEGLGLLAGGVAHDFNNILSVVLGNVRLLEPSLRGDPEGLERLRKIQIATDRAAQLSRRMLDYAGQSRPVNQALQLPELVRDVCSLVETSIPKKVALKAPQRGEVPDASGDPTLLRQVLMNLILNGAEAIGDQEGVISVEVGHADLDAQVLAEMAGAADTIPGPFVFLEVRDTGAGMDSATKDRIFDPFFTSKSEGRGLGLASVLGIVRSHHGAIDVESTPDLGTRFRVFLPIAVGSSPHERPASRSEPIGGEGQLVLIAEDEPGVSELVTEVLESAGYRTLAVSDGREAASRFREAHKEVDAVLLDVTMPMMSGLEALAVIREIDPDVPVVLMTGDDSKVTGSPVQPSALLRKPFENAELVATVGQVLEARRRSKAAQQR